MPSNAILHHLSLKTSEVLFRGVETIYKVGGTQFNWYQCFEWLPVFLAYQHFRHVARTEARRALPSSVTRFEPSIESTGTFIFPLQALTDISPNWFSERKIGW